MAFSILHLILQRRFSYKCGEEGQGMQILMSCVCWLQVSEPQRHISHYHYVLRSNLVRSKGARSGAMGRHFRLKCSTASTRVQQLVAPTGCRNCQFKVLNFDYLSMITMAFETGTWSRMIS